MQYIQVRFVSDPHSEVITDLLSSLLADIGFESFVTVKGGVEAYLPASLFSRTKIDALLAHFPMEAHFSYSHQLMEDKNWNEEWEKNYFKPVVIADSCCIHSTCHPVEGSYPFQILIDPKMAFGTGHHQTTELMIREMIHLELQGRSVLDMGCGTALLAILASMKGADPVTAIDIDEWAYENARENIELNRRDKIRLLQGGAEHLYGDHFDLILANINRNILLRDIPLYEQMLQQKGTIIMSGFYRDDIPSIRERCEEVGMAYHHYSEKDQWASVTCTRR